jgi:hypothetical protein
MAILTTYRKLVPVTGQFLAHTRHHRLNKVRLSFLGADLVKGNVYLIDPTVTQTSGLVGVSESYIHAAIRRYADRGPIECGDLPLVPPATPVNAEDRLARLINAYGFDRIIDMRVVAEHKIKGIAA